MKKLLSTLAEKIYDLNGNTVIDWDVAVDIITDYLDDLEDSVIKPAIDIELNRLIVEVKKIQIKDADFVVIKAKNKIKNNDFYHLFAEKIRYVLGENNLKNVTVLLTDSETDIGTLNEKMMFEIGWLKKEKINKIISGLENTL